MDCDHCRRFAEENESLTDEISGLMYTTRRQAASIAGLERELRKVRREDPNSKTVEFVLTRWKRLLGHPKAKCPPEGKRWKIVSRALRDHSPQEVLEAIEGLSLMPYVDKRGRKVSGHPTERYDDVEHALGDEVRIKNCRQILKRAQTASVEQLHHARIQAMCLELAILRQLQDAHARKDTRDLLMARVARDWHYSVSSEEARAA